METHDLHQTTIAPSSSNPISTDKFEWEDKIDMAFINRIIRDVTKSCALPFKLPMESIPEYIIQAMGWFVENVDFACEERVYMVKNSDFCKSGIMNKIMQLPNRIEGVHGCFKMQDTMKFGVMGDFSLERMLMSSYSQFGGAGTVAGGFSGTTGMAGFTLQDVVTSMYEVDTFNQYLNPPLTYSFNPYSKKLNILGDLGWSDVLLQCSVRLRLQDFYNAHYFFKLVSAYVKQNLEVIYTTWEFKNPGGISINFNKIAEMADHDIDEIKEWAENNRACDYFLQPNTM